MLIVFDLDGTLIDSIGDITAAVNLVRQARSQAELSQEFCSQHVGWGARYLLERTVEYPAAEGKAVYAEFIEAYKRVIGVYAKPYDGIPEVLLSLKSDGHTLAVLSNKPHELTVSCVAKALPDVFTTVFGKRVDVPAKPAPDALLEITSVHATLASVFVGDSEVDVQTAAAASVPCIAVSWGLRTIEQLHTAHAPRIVHTPAELLQELNM